MCVGEDEDFDFLLARGHFLRLEKSAFYTTRESRDLKL
jgi:hypothetical protein